MEHSHRCSYFNREKNLVSSAKNLACDIVCFGHTHASMIRKMDGVFLLNPGSVTFPRDGKPRSYAILDVDKEIHAKIIFMDENW